MRWAACGNRRGIRDRRDDGQLHGGACRAPFVLEQVGWNVESDGLFGAPLVTVVVGDEAHPTLMRGLSIGLRARTSPAPPVDGQGRIRADQLPKLTGRALSASGWQCQHGRVRSAELCAWAHGAGAWACRRRLWRLGRRRFGTICARIRSPILGDRCAQVAECAPTCGVRARSSICAARSPSPPPISAGGCSRAVTIHARVVAPRARASRSGRR